MTDTPSAATQTVVVAPSRSIWKDWVPLLALLVTIAFALSGELRTMGGDRAATQTNTREIADLKRRMTDQEVKTSGLGERWARIETKVDLIFERLTGDRGR